MNTTNTDNYILIRQALYSSCIDVLKESKRVVLFTSYYLSQSHTVVMWEELKLGLKNADIRRKEAVEGKVPFKSVLSLVTKHFEFTSLKIKTVEVRDRFLVVLLAE
jgi:hypothetical protein